MNFSELLQNDLNEIEQIKRRHIAKEQREIKKENKTSKSLIFNVGECFLKYFPEYLSLQPNLSKADKDVEFASLEKFLSTIANDEELLHKIRKQTDES
ncbi:MAG: hypothetical protein FWG90_00240 [Oscillospiraceae bacterium]|nr:hypothetical protein [Oscillospiraceae bacterium]